MTTSPWQFPSSRRPGRALRPAFATSAVLVAIAIGLVACDSGDYGRTPQAARPAEENSQTFGNLEVHYNALRTDELTPEVARAYGIERSGNRVLLNVSLLEKTADGRTAPIDGTVTATARNLNGQLKDLEMRRIQEGPSIYFIGEVGISGNEIVVFDIELVPNDGSGRRSVQFKREFFGE
jgi:hypothetical protein